MFAAGWLKKKSSIVASVIALVIIIGVVSFLHDKSLISSQGRTGYADPQTCATCHQQISKNYQQTGMGRSFHKMTLADGNTFSAQTIFSHSLSGKVYQMSRRGEEFLMHRTSADGENAYSARVDYVIGSGNHARTYLHRTADGKLMELPVSWYSELGGQWNMSPGYDQKDQVDFRRPIGKDCMFCHNGYPESDPVDANLADGAVFVDKLPEGIDCQRCHGPGAAHVKAAKAWWPNADQVRSSIVNPAHLPRERSLDVCRQCHLETTSLNLPNSIRRYDRDIYSFKAGESLSDYRISFDRKLDKRFDDRFEVAHQAYRLEKSQCFLKSDMTCTTCHNPHKAPRGEAAVKQYIAVCEGCHRADHPKLQGTKTVAAGSNCLSCHMWQRRTEDVVHVVMTDHYIQRFKPAADPLALLKEELPLYQGEVVPYDPKLLSVLPEGELYTAVAQVEGDSNSSANLSRLQSDLQKTKPNKAGFYFSLASAYAKTGKDAEAVPWFEEALKFPDHSSATQRELAVALAGSQQTQRALTVAEQAVAASPKDVTALTNLGNLYLQVGRTLDAQQTLHRALAGNPELADANNLLGLSYEQMRRPAEAQESFRRALQLNPDHAEATVNLATSLADQGDVDQATQLMRKALAKDPQNASMHRSYAMVFATNRQFDRAIEQMQEAIRLRPTSASFYIDMADLLVARGRFSQGQTAYRQAIRLDSKMAKAHIGLASMLMAQNKLSDAEQEYRMAVLADPRNGEAHLALADLASRKGILTEARQELEMAAESGDPAARETAYKALHGVR